MTNRISARTSRVSILLVFAAALLFQQPSPANAQVRPEASVGLLLGVPSGAFADNVSGTGIGVNLTGGIQLPQSPVFLGVEFGYLMYGHDSRSEAFNAAIPDVRVDVVTSNNIVLGNFLLRFQSATGKVRPYLDGLVGFKYLYTETTVKDDSDWSWDPIANSVNFDDWALSYGIGVGAAIALWERDPGSERKPPSGVYLDFGVRYLLGTEAEYLKEGSIQRVGGQVTFQPDSSKTDMIHPHFQIRASF